MNDKQQGIERRKHERFEVQDDAYAMITPLSHKKGEIIDISKGGVALRYIPDGKKPRLSKEIDMFLHIFLKDISFCLLRLPIKTISDTPIEDDESPVARRRCVQFHALSQMQTSELDYFIQNHVTV
jgi:c-di-GMP-binding flagellar brake protein YcgR